MMNDTGGVLLIFCFVTFAVLAIGWHYSRAASLLQRWAEQHDYRIIHKEYRYLFRGPYFWTTSKGQVVYRITIEDPEGTVASGWARCGGWFLGLLSDRVEVRWDD
jgi:hypothetical protein